MENKSQKSSIKKIILFGIIVLTLSSFAFFSKNIFNQKTIHSDKAVTNSCDCYSTSKLNKIPINFSNQVPGDLNNFNQSSADCFAWQEFIALNWPANSANSFGAPNDLNPTQWETYMPRDVLFQPNGMAPPTWGTLVSEQYAQKFKSQRLLMNRTKTKLLTFTSKFSLSDTLSDMGFGQAAPFNGPNWLGAQNGKNVWYEIMLNKDYYNYVVKNGFYNAQTQHDSVIAGSPINFPMGKINAQGQTTQTGAIELKAAWMEIDTNSSPLKWKRYKLSLATVMDATTGTLRTTTVALVGLHILHKTQNQPTWVWATFEQIDNTPSTGDNPANHPYGYNFYNAKCNPQQVTYKSPYSKADTTVIVSCTANASPPYYLKYAAPTSIQVTRINSIDQTNAAPINKRMQDSIKKFYPNSVWQYYQLVDVMWSQGPQSGLKPASNVPFPLNKALMTSGANILANTTMESYVQKQTCTSCHVYSTIAADSTDTAHNQIFGDFSFAIGFATSPKSISGERIKKYLKNKR